MQVMEWAIATNSANILTHLRDMGYPIPLEVIQKYPLIIRDYLLGKPLPQPLIPGDRGMCRGVPTP